MRPPLVLRRDVDIATCPFGSTQIMVDALSGLPGAAITANWTAWEVLNQPVGYLEVHGSAFSFATIKAGGHEAPGYQPLSSYTLVSSFITGSLDKILVPAPASAPKAKEGAALEQPKRLTQSSILKDAVRKTLAERRTAAALKQ